MKDTFCPIWYTSQYPDVAMSNITPADHFSAIGKQLGRSMNPNQLSFRETSTDRTSSREQEHHFDHRWYLSTNPDVTESGIDPYLHYTNWGWKEKRNPNLEFSTDYYLRNNPDVAASSVNPFIHYYSVGRNELRSPNFFAPIPPCLREYSDAVTLPSPLANYFKDGQPWEYAKRNEHKDLNVAIHLHAHYADVLDSIIASIANASFSFDLYVTSTNDECDRALDLRLNQLQGLRTYTLSRTRNRGRDVGPWLESHSQLSKYDLVLHIHTKKRTANEDLGAKWLNQILNCVLGGPESTAAIFNYFICNPRCGALFPSPLPEVRNLMTWGENKYLVSKLLNRAHSSVVCDELTSFPAGTIFWYRPIALRNLFELNIGLDDFPPEPIPHDGTLAHAVERSIPYFLKNNGYYSVNSKIHLHQFGNYTADSPLVSIIVPCHNASKWIHQSLSSVLNGATLAVSYEIILVENGSSDSTFDVISWYADQFPFIKAFSCATASAGTARNIGLRNASGRYVTFLDADDVLGRFSLDFLSARADEVDADLVISPLCMFNETLLSPPLPHGIRHSNFTLTQIQEEAHHTDPLSVIDAMFSDFGPCAKLYRLSFLKENEINFTEGVNFEDNFFVYSCYCSAKNIASISRVTYYYRRDHQQSQSTIVNEKSVHDFFQSHRALLKLIKTLSPPIYQIARKNLLQRLRTELSRFGLTVREVPDDIAAASGLANF
jgi:glycosyltransferase involved in cell wall biosynthesis